MELQEKILYGLIYLGVCILVTVITGAIAHISFLVLLIRIVIVLGINIGICSLVIWSTERYSKILEATDSADKDANIESTEVHSNHSTDKGVDIIVGDATDDDVSSSSDEVEGTPTNDKALPSSVDVSKSIEDSLFNTGNKTPDTKPNDDLKKNNTSDDSDDDFTNTTTTNNISESKSNAVFSPKPPPIATTTAETPSISSERARPDSQIQSKINHSSRKEPLKKSVAYATLDKAIEYGKKIDKERDEVVNKALFNEIKKTEDIMLKQPQRVAAAVRQMFTGVAETSE